MDTENIVNVPVAKKTISQGKRRFWIASSIVFVLVIILTVYFIHRLQTIHEVQVALSNAASVMQKANGDNGYPQSLPAAATTDKKVRMTGGGSFDGTTYCIVGTSTDDGSIVYHIVSGNKQSQAGGCPAIMTTAKPGPVSEIAPTIISAGQLGYTWNSASGGVSYTLQCATDKDFTQSVVTSMKATTNRTCNNLNQLTTYYVRIRANNAIGAGPWSPAFSSTTGGLSTAPAGLTINPVSSTSISYSWKPVPGALSYIVQWAADINFIKDLKVLSTSTTSGVATGLNPNTRYFFQVKAVTASFDASHAAFSPEIYVTTPAH